MSSAARALGAGRGRCRVPPPRTARPPPFPRSARQRRPGMSAGQRRGASGGAQRRAKPVTSPGATANVVLHRRIGDHSSTGRRREGAPGRCRRRCEPPRRFKTHERPDQSVLGARRELDPELYLAGESRDAPKQLVRGVQAEVVAVLAFRERHRVGERHPARVGCERRFEHERAWEIAPLQGVRAWLGRSTSGQRPGQAGVRRRRRCRTGVRRASRSTRALSTSAAELQSASSP